MDYHHEVATFEDGVGLPPGTFKLIQGNRHWILYERGHTDSQSIDDDSDLRGQRAVMLDPIPSNDPNEPLVYPSLVLPF